jgi:hypothetical protein
LNPGSLAPQASVLIQPRLRAPSTRLLCSGNINADVKGKIINTLLELKNNGLEEQTVEIVGFYLNHLAGNVDLVNPETVRVHSRIKCEFGFRGKPGQSLQLPCFSQQYCTSIDLRPLLHVEKRVSFYMNVNRRFF